MNAALQVIAEGVCNVETEFVGAHSECSTTLKQKGKSGSGTTSEEMAKLERMDVAVTEVSISVVFFLCSFNCASVKAQCAANGNEVSRFGNYVLIFE